MVVDLCPHIPRIPSGRSEVDAPIPELHRGPSPDKSIGPHVAKPNRVMRRHDELRIGKLRLQKCTHFTTMASVHGHENVVEHGEREPGALEVPHKCEVQAQAHAVLVALAVIRARGEEAATVEVHVETEFSHRRDELSLKLVFIVAVGGAIEGREVVLDGCIDPCEYRITGSGVDVVYLPCPLSLLLGGLLFPHCVAADLKPLLRDREPLPCRVLLRRFREASDRLLELADRVEDGLWYDRDVREERDRVA